MDNIFAFRNQLITDYRTYVDSFVQIRDPHIQRFVQQQLQQGVIHHCLLLASMTVLTTFGVILTAGAFFVQPPSLHAFRPALPATAHSFHLLINSTILNLMLREHTH
jgi:hypothetical protein